MSTRNKRKTMLVVLIFSVAFSVYSATENIFKQDFPSLVAAIFTGFILIFAWDYLSNSD